MGWPSLSVCEARPWPTPMAELPCWGARGSAKRRRFALLSVFPWFSGLFSKHRSCTIVILEPLRSSLRYGRNGSCFVGFRGRLTLQTPRNVEGCQRNGLSGTQQGSPSLTGARPLDGRASVSARLGHGRPPWPSSPVGGLGGRPSVVGSPF